MAQNPDVTGREILPIPDIPSKGKMALDARNAEFPARIDLFGGIQGGRYRLEDRHDGPGGVGEGALSLRQADVGLATRIELWKRLRVLFEAGVVLSQSIEFEDEDGDSIDERETREPAFRGRIALKWQF